MEQKTKIYALTLSLKKGGAERQILMLNSLIGLQKLLLINKIVHYNTGNLAIESALTKNVKGFSLLIRLPLIILFLTKKIQRTDTLISFLFLPNLLNIFIKNLKNHKVIVSERCIISRAYRNKLTKKLVYILIKLFYPHADHIVANSYGVKDDLVKNFGLSDKKISVISNTYDINEIKQKSEQELNEKYSYLFTQNKVILGVGRVDPRKGFEFLIKAFKLFHSEYDNYILVIILSSGDLRNYKKIIKALKLEKKVFLLPKQENPYQFMRNADIFFLSSHTEGLPNVLIEAVIASGAPVISTDCYSGPREILNDESSYNQEMLSGIKKAKYGILVPPIYLDDQEKEKNSKIRDWANAMKEFEINPALFNQNTKKQKDFLRKFSTKEIKSKWQKLIFINKEFY